MAIYMRDKVFHIFGKEKSFPDTAEDPLICDEKETVSRSCELGDDASDAGKADGIPG